MCRQGMGVTGKGADQVPPLEAERNALGRGSALRPSCLPAGPSRLGSDATFTPLTSDITA